MNCNLATVELMKISAGAEEEELLAMVRRHLQFTGSQQAQRALEDWPQFLQQCVKVMPTDYKAVLEEMEQSSEVETAAV